MAGPTPFGQFERTLAWRYLRATRANGGVSVVSIVSFVGIMLAVMALIVVMSVMSGFRATLLDALLGGSGHIYVQVQDETQETVDQLTLNVSNLVNVEAAVPIVQGEVLADSGFVQTGARVRGLRISDLNKLEFLNKEDQLSSRLGIITGGEAEARSQGFGEGKNGGDTILLGLFLSQKLRAFPGDKITLVAPDGIQGPFGKTPRSKTYRVGGVFKTGSVELDDFYIFMPMRQAQLFFGKSDKYDILNVTVREAVVTAPTINAINDLTAYKYAINDWKRERQQYFDALNTERSMMMIIMLILVVITSLNIITGVVMLVKNKTRDIAILRTVGTSRGSIMRTFIMIGGLLGLTGALIGAFLGVVITLNIGSVIDFVGWIIGRELFPPTVYGLDGLPAELNWSEVSFVTLWAMGMSMVVTILPAWGAARLDPVDALRFE
jgi:lipoprotein-releasing system permease protein